MFDDARGWFVTSVPAIFTQDPDMRELFGPLDAARITATDTDDGMIRVDWVGEGSDEAAIAAAAALASDPQLPDAFCARPMLKEMIEQSRQWLPQFKLD